MELSNNYQGPVVAYQSNQPGSISSGDKIIKL